MRIRTIAAVAIACLAGSTLALAAPVTKDDAVAMVKKAVAAIKADGPEKAYVEINKGGQFADGEIYVVVSNFDGVTVAHATNPKLLGKNMTEVQDVDGKYFSKNMTELARKETSFWYDYKFANPATKKIQVKDNYCEVLSSSRVCAGVYRP
jgi:signal transduction histidine kinase